MNRDAASPRRPRRHGHGHGHRACRAVTVTRPGRRAAGGESWTASARATVTVTGGRLSPGRPTQCPGRPTHWPGGHRYCAAAESLPLGLRPLSDSAADSESSRRRARAGSPFSESARVTSESGQPRPLTRPAAEPAGIGLGQWLAWDRPGPARVRYGASDSDRRPIAGPRAAPLIETINCNVVVELLTAALQESR
jgi:hypothetical protein